MAKITHYDQGDVWTPQATFTVNGTPTDPTTLIVKIKDPAGTITTITENTPAAPTLPIVRVSAGVFKHNGIALNDAGYWHARFEGTGAAAAAEDHQAIVDPSEFYESAQLGSRALVGLAETKDWLQQQNIDTASDLELARVINDISERFHDEAEREFKVVGTNPQTRTFQIDPPGRRLPYYIDGDYIGDRNIARRTVKVGDLSSFTAVSILDSDWTTVLETPSVSLVTGHPLVRKAWEPIRELELHADVTSLVAGMRLSVTGNWGFPAVPGNVRQAVLDAVAAVMDRDVEHYRQDLGFGGAQQAQGGGTVVMVGGGRQRLLSMPPASLAVAWSYRDTNLG
jgi:hypothetical protein